MSDAICQTSSSDSKIKDILSTVAAIMFLVLLPVFIHIVGLLAMVWLVVAVPLAVCISLYQYLRQVISPPKPQAPLPPPASPLNPEPNRCSTTLLPQYQGMTATELTRIALYGRPGPIFMPTPRCPMCKRAVLMTHPTEGTLERFGEEVVWHKPDGTYTNIGWVKTFPKWTYRNNGWIPNYDKEAWEVRL